MKYLPNKKEMNLHQQRWIKLLKDYDFTIEYHPGKAKVVVDALNRKTISTLAYLKARIFLVNNGSLLAELRVQPVFLSQILKSQLKDT